MRNTTLPVTIFIFISLGLASFIIISFILIFSWRLIRSISIKPGHTETTMSAKGQEFGVLCGSINGALWEVFRNTVAQLTSKIEAT